MEDADGVGAQEASVKGEDPLLILSQSSQEGDLKPSDQLSCVGTRETLDFILLSVSGKTIRNRIGKLA